MSKFAAELQLYGVTSVRGDAYAGETYRRDFQSEGITYTLDSRSASDLYEAIEPKINAGEVELLDDAKLIDQWVSLIWRGNKIDHQGGAHDDYCNAAAGALLSVSENNYRRMVRFSPKAVENFKQRPASDLYGFGCFNPSGGGRF